MSVARRITAGRPGTKPGRRGRSLYCVLVATIAAGASLHAGNVRDAARVSHHIELPPITLSELLPGHAAAIRVDGGQIDEALPAPLTTIVREIPLLWELEVPAGSDLSALEVMLQLSAVDGSGSRLALDGSAGGDGIRVMLQPTPPRIAGRRGQSLVVQGGARLLLHIGHLTEAGSFRGNLVFNIEPW